MSLVFGKISIDTVMHIVWMGKDSARYLDDIMTYTNKEGKSK